MNPPPNPPSALAQLWAQLKTPRAPGRETGYPPIRNFILDLMAEGRRKNIVHVIFQADITDLLSRLAAATTDRTSVTSVVAAALAQVIEQHKHLNAYRVGKSRMVIFDDVDLSFTVEREVDGVLLPVPYIVRAANRKSVEQIHQELQAAKVAPIGATGPMSALEKSFFLMPNFVRRMVWFFIRRDPWMFKQLAGTVGVTSIGMFAAGAVVVQPITPMTLTLCIGSTERKVVMQDGGPVERAFIHLNVSIDHDIIDGGPLMRFVAALGKRLGEGS